MLILKETARQKKIAGIKADFSIPRFEGIQQSWADARPPLRYDVSRIASHMVKEVAEVEEVLNAPKPINVAKAGMESIDVLWLALGIARDAEIRLSPYAILNNLNGFGKRSDIFDNIREVALNLPLEGKHNDKLKTELEHLFTLVLSLVADLPEYVSPDILVDRVFAKNRANYPVEAFNGRHPISGEKLSEEEMDRAYAHARDCFRFIRDHLVKKLGWKDRENGLKRSDWVPYFLYIVGYEFAEYQLAELKKKVETDFPVGMKELDQTVNPFDALFAGPLLTVFSKGAYGSIT